MTQLQEAIRDKITKYSDACGMCTDTTKDCDTCGITCVLEDLNELQELSNNPGASQTKEPVRLIDANETIEALNRAEIELYPSEYKAFQKAIDEIPTIDPESLRPTAHWISDGGGSANVVCSACNAISFAAYNFCPECGAKMVSAND